MHGYTTVKTYAAQFEKALLIASRLDENVHSTEPILLCYSTISENIPAAWACLLSGREFHPCSPALLYRDKVAFWEQFDRSMMSLNADAVLSDAETATTLRTIAKEQGSAATIDDTSSWAMQGQPKSHILYENLTPANVYIQTSGSTGIPKLACISGDTLMHRFYDGIGPDNRVMLNVLASHSIGGMRTILPLGRTNIRLEPARLMALPQSWWELVNKYQVTDVDLTNLNVSNLIAHMANGAAYNAKSLERLAFGAEPIKPATITRFFQLLRHGGMRNAKSTFVYSMT